jgi:hypothetical protein
MFTCLDFEFEGRHSVAMHTMLIKYYVGNRATARVDQPTKVDVVINLTTVPASETSVRGC